SLLLSDATPTMPLAVICEPPSCWLRCCPCGGNPKPCGCWPRCCPCDGNPKPCGCWPLKVVPGVLAPPTPWKPGCWFPAIGDPGCWPCRNVCWVFCGCCICCC